MPRRRITRIAVPALVALALALAAPLSPAADPQPDPAGGRAVEVRVIEHDEFRWGDAAVGALGGVGLAAVCAGVLVATGRKRRPMS